MQYKTSTSSLWQSFASPSNDYRIGISGVGDALTIDSSFKVGIGMTSPLSVASGYGALTVGGSTGGGIIFSNTSSGHGQVFANSSQLTVDAFSSRNLTFQTNGTERMRITATGVIQSSDGTTTGEWYPSGGVQYFGTSTNHPIQFFTNNVLAMRLDASGNLLVGKTTASIGTVGCELRNDGYILGVNDGDAPLFLNRKSSDGDIAKFYKDGSPVGSIGTNLSDLTIGTGDTGAKFVDGFDTIVPFNTSTNSESDGVVSFGASANRWKDLYLSGGVHLGGTGSANKLDDYEEGTWTLSITTTGLQPTVTIGNTTGRYTKIGNKVTATIYTSALNITVAGSGALKLDGLPFQCSGQARSYAVPSFGHTNCFTDEAEGYVAINTTYIIVTPVNSVSNNSLVVGSPKYMMVTVTYFTDS
jgi:hypothetical protein